MQKKSGANMVQNSSSKEAEEFWGLGVLGELVPRCLREAPGPPKNEKNAKMSKFFVRTFAQQNFKLLNYFWGGHGPPWEGPWAFQGSPPPGAQVLVMFCGI